MEAMYDLQKKHIRLKYLIQEIQIRAAGIIKLVNLAPSLRSEAGTTIPMREGSLFTGQSSRRLTLIIKEHATRTPSEEVMQPEVQSLGATVWHQEDRPALRNCRQVDEISCP